MRLDSSAIHAIDDDPKTSWITPPKDPEQSMVVALPARSLIEQIGLAIARGEVPRAVVFERSIDGQTFLPMATIESPDATKGAFENVAPVEASFLRVTIQEASEKTVSITSLSASGTETAAYVRPPLGGGWRINELDARFTHQGSRINGVLETDPPTLIEGGWSGRTIHFLYMRGNEFGLGAITVSPDGGFLNSMWWYQKVEPLHAAPVWFGRRTGEESPSSADWQITGKWLERFGSAPIFGVEFDADGQLRAEASEQSLQWLASRLSAAGSGPITILKRDLTHASPEAARNVIARQLESLRRELARRGVDVARVEFESAGTEGLEKMPEVPLEREILSRLELRLGPAIP